jgi:hypothetical protein
MVSLAAMDYLDRRESLDLGDFLVFLEIPPEGVLDVLDPKEVKEPQDSLVLEAVMVSQVFLE